MQVNFIDSFFAEVAMEIPYVVLPNTSGNTDALVQLAKRVHIDPFRIYQTGFSQGGHRSIQLLWQHPDHYAAVIAHSPDLRLPNQWFYWECIRWLKNSPVRLIQGSNDNYIDGTWEVYSTMLEAGCPVEMTTWPGGHFWQCFVNLDDFHIYMNSFFRRHIMNPYPKTVTHAMEMANYNYSRAFWVNGKLARQFTSVDKAGVNPVYQITAQPNNIISIDSADGLYSAFDFYLDSHLVDMNEPVTVVKGGETVYEGDIPADGKVSVTLFDVYQEPPTLTDKGGLLPAQHLCNPDDKALWQRLDSIRCAVFGNCSTAVPVAAVQPAMDLQRRGQGMELVVGPNPFSTSVNISLEMRTANSELRNMQIGIYDIHGKLIQQLNNRGSHSAFRNSGYTWNALNHPVGTYIVRAKVGKKTLSKKVTLIK
jgi:hypothetical protein